MAQQLYHYRNALTEVEYDEDVAIEDEFNSLGFDAQLLVYNDDHNTFDWVIDSFVEILQHSSEQAEQLALLIHFKGRATVKTAPFEVLRPLKDALIDRGLSAVIEGNNDC